jgi:hypothetical protein
MPKKNQPIAENTELTNPSVIKRLNDIVHTLMAVNNDDATFEQTKEAALEALGDAVLAKTQLERDKEAEADIRKLLNEWLQYPFKNYLKLSDLRRRTQETINKNEER